MADGTVLRGFQVLDMDMQVGNQAVTRIGETSKGLTSFSVISDTRC